MVQMDSGGGGEGCGTLHMGCTIGGVVPGAVLLP